MGHYSFEFTKMLIKGNTLCVDGSHCEVCFGKVGRKLTRVTARLTEKFENCDFSDVQLVTQTFNNDFFLGGLISHHDNYVYRFTILLDSSSYYICLQQKFSIYLISVSNI